MEKSPGLASLRDSHVAVAHQTSVITMAFIVAWRTNHIML